jgi:endonuclease YncB( thermonuclease family)
VSSEKTKTVRGALMLRFFLALLPSAYCLLPTAFCLLTGPPPLGIALRCQVVDVVDGDTIEVEVTQRVRVRLVDCWAPESRTKDLAEKRRGLAAKARLETLAKGRPATLFVPTGDARTLGDVTTLGRLVGKVWIDGEETSLSEQQVRAGLASTTKGGALGR